MGVNITWRLSDAQASTPASQPLSGSYTQAGGSETYISQNYTTNGTNQLLNASWGVSGNSTGNIQGIFLLASQNCTIKTNGTNTADVQTVSITGTPTGGTFPLVFSGQVTKANSYNTNSSTLQTNLQALSTIGSGNATCSGGPLPGTPIVVTFAGSLNTGLQPLMTTESGDLTGGSSPTVSVAHTTPGTPQDTLNLLANIPFEWDNNRWYASPFAGAVNSLYVTNAQAFLLQIKVLQF